MLERISCLSSRPTPSNGADSERVVVVRRDDKHTQRDLQGRFVFAAQTCQHTLVHMCWCLSRTGWLSRLTAPVSRPSRTPARLTTFHFLYEGPSSCDAEKWFSEPDQTQKDIATCSSVFPALTDIPFLFTHPSCPVRPPRIQSGTDPLSLGSLRLVLAATFLFPPP